MERLTFYATKYGKTAHAFKGISKDDAIQKLGPLER